MDWWLIVARLRRLLHDIQHRPTGERVPYKIVEPLGNRKELVVEGVAYTREVGDA